MSTIESSLRTLLERVTKKFVQEKQRDDKEGHHAALRARSIERLKKTEAKEQEKITIKTAAWSVMKRAYMLASDNGRLPANIRQIMYAARALVIKMIGKCWAKSGQFTQTILPEYMATHEAETANWDVVADARGHFQEPHSRRSIGIGTLDVRGYLNSWTNSGDVDTDVEPPELDDSFPTCGPANRFKYALFIEKEGFDPLLERAQIAAKYDMAIFSSKGMSVIAARKLVDKLSQEGVTVFVLHDFDRAGLLIAHWLSHDNDRYEFERSPNVIDLGLRLDDVKRLGLEKEPLVYKQKKNPADALDECDDVTSEEINFLVGHRIVLGNGYRNSYQWPGFRVELNAMLSRQFIDWLEAKFKEHGVEKVIPDNETLDIAWQRALMIAKINEAVDAVGDEFKERRKKMEKPPRDLAKRLRDLLRHHPELPWDKALVRIAREKKAAPHKKSK